MDPANPNQNTNPTNTSGNLNSPSDPALGNVSNPQMPASTPPAASQPDIPTPAFMDPSVGTVPPMPTMPPTEEKPKSGMLVKASLILLIVVLVFALGYIAFAKLIKSPANTIEVSEQPTEERQVDYAPTEEQQLEQQSMPAEGEGNVDEMQVEEDLSTETDVVITEETTPEPTFEE